MAYYSYIHDPCASPCMECLGRGYTVEDNGWGKEVHRDCDMCGGRGIKSVRVSGAQPVAPSKPPQPEMTDDDLVDLYRTRMRMNALIDIALAFAAAAAEREDQTELERVTIERFEDFRRVY